MIWMVDANGDMRAVSTDQYTQLPTEVVEKYHCTVSLAGAIRTSERLKRAAAERN